MTAPPAPERSDFRYLERLRVRWAEVDAQNIVFNGHYLMYLDTASAGYWRALATPFAETLQALGGDLFVRRATVEYAAPARYDEQLEVGLRCASIGRSSMRFVAGVFRAGRLLVTGELVYVYAHPVQRVSLPVPPALRAAIEGFEAGAPSVQVAAGTDETLRAEARSLQRRVRAHEEGETDPVGDEASASAQPPALHLVARNPFGQCVAAARLVPEGSQALRLSWLAVHPLLRGSGFGRDIVQAAAREAREQGARELLAAVAAADRGFFERFGFGVGLGPAGQGALEMKREL